jgi:RHS repeat-associated protein
MIGTLGASPLVIWDIDTMQVSISIRTPDAPMTLPAACLFSEASGHRSISTGKERDAESGNDYFGARYYASSMGRFMSPDWSAKAEPVPYAKLNDPQTLNLYAYVGNNPLTRTDPTGHWCLWGIGTTCTPPPPPPPPAPKPPAPKPPPPAPNPPAPKPPTPTPPPNPAPQPVPPIAGILYPAANAAAQAAKAAVNPPGPPSPPPSLIPSGPVVQPPVEETPMQQLVKILGDALSNAADMADTFTDVIPPMYIPCETTNPGGCA